MNNDESRDSGTERAAFEGLMKLVDAYLDAFSNWDIGRELEGLDERSPEWEARASRNKREMVAARETLESALRAALRAAPPLEGLWISVKDRMPPVDGAIVFVGVNETGFACCFNAIYRGETCAMDSPEDSVDLMSGLAWWMPLPAPPAGSAGADSGSAVHST